MNIVILQGNLVDDVKVYTNKDGIKIVKGVIGITREYTKKKESDYIPFTVIGNSVDYAEKYGKKGVKILLKGSWNHSAYKDKQGNTKSADSCLAETIKFFAEKSNVVEKTVEETNTNEDISDDDLPF